MKYGVTSEQKADGYHLGQIWNREEEIKTPLMIDVRVAVYQAITTTTEVYLGRRETYSALKPHSATIIASIWEAANQTPEPIWWPLRTRAALVSYIAMREFIFPGTAVQYGETGYDSGGSPISYDFGPIPDGWIGPSVSYYAKALDYYQSRSETVTSILPTGQIRFLIKFYQGMTLLSSIYADDPNFRGKLINSNGIFELQLSPDAYPGNLIDIEILGTMGSNLQRLGDKQIVKNRRPGLPLPSAIVAGNLGTLVRYNKKNAEFY